VIATFGEMWGCEVVKGGARESLTRLSSADYEQSGRADRVEDEDEQRVDSCAEDFPVGAEHDPQQVDKGERDGER
jgi:hypothetical protein